MNKKKAGGLPPDPLRKSPPPPPFIFVRPPLARSRSHCKMLGIGVFLLSIAFVTAVRVPMGMRAPPVPKDTVLPSESWYTQLLDHISANDTTTWQQRYFVNDSFWTPTGPVFLLLGGEDEASPTWLVGDNELMLNARKYGAMAIMLEHRYVINKKRIPIDPFLSITCIIGAAVLAYSGEHHTWPISPPPPPPPQSYVLCCIFQ